VVVGVFGAVITGRERSSFSAAELLLVGWLSACLAFLNTWDLPIYLALILAAAFWGSRQDGLAVAARRVLVSGVAIMALAVATVLPWLPTFASQAGGILPNLVYPTRLPQFLIMFAVPLVPAALWLLLHAKDELRRPGGWRLVAGVTVGLPLAMLILSWLLAALVAMTSPEEAFAAMRSLGASGWTELASAAFVRRLDAPSVALLLSLLLGLAWLYLRRAHRESAVSASGGGQAAFVVLMVALGAGPMLFPEFLYLRDSFGSRMNTVFKFYYAAWLLWGVAGAYALAGPWETFGRRGRLWGVVAAVPVALGLVYTTTALWEKANHFNLDLRPQLDGTAHLDQTIRRTLSPSAGFERRLSLASWPKLPAEATHHKGPAASRHTPVFQLSWAGTFTSISGAGTMRLRGRAPRIWQRSIKRATGRKRARSWNNTASATSTSAR
jgi:uncharacterized membrane protein